MKLRTWVVKGIPRFDQDRLLLDLLELNNAKLTGDQRFHVTRITNILCDRPKPKKVDD